VLNIIHKKKKSKKFSFIKTFLSSSSIVLSDESVLRIRIRDPVPFRPLDPGSGTGRKLASGSGIRDEQPGSYFLELKKPFFCFFGVKILKFFDEDPGSGMETVRIRDPGWKKVGSGIRDKHP
jgi:hypothetical protein